MRQHTAVFTLSLLGGVFALGLLALAWMLGPGASQAEDATMHNCPQPGKWAMSVWDGADGTETGEALATCGAGAVDFAYYLDPGTNSWLGYFEGRPEVSKLLTLDHMQGVIAHRAVGAPGPTPTPEPTPSPQQGAMQNCPLAGKWAISVWSGQDGVGVDQALATCGPGAVSVVYYLDPDTGGWLRWFAGKPDVSNLPPFSNMQAALALGSAAQPVATPTPAGGAPLKIGLLLDYTGSLGAFGPTLETGAQLAVSQINAAGGVLGKPVQLIKADSGTNPQVAVEEATRLVNVEVVQAIVGSLASGVTIAVAEGVAVPNKVIMISPVSTSPGLSAVADDDFLYRIVLSDAAQGVVLADWAVQQGYKKVSTLYTNNAYGKGLSDQFVESFRAAGGEVPAAVSHEIEQTTYLSELLKAVEGEPDALVCISYPFEGKVYLKEAIENDLIKTFLLTDGTKSQEIVDAVGATALEGTTGTSPSTTARAELTAEFDADYKAEYGKDVPSLPYVRESYDAVVVIALAAEAAKSTDPTKIRDHLRKVAGPPGDKIGAGAAGVKQALEAIRAGKDIDFEGAANSDDFDVNGDVLTGAIEIFKITGGKFETVKIVQVSLASP
jgi:ABC-type branched-subunit amino acid transport system substrate-binding protein